jgi:hypothetical protein
MRRAENREWGDEGMSQSQIVASVYSGFLLAPVPFSRDGASKRATRLT